MKKQVLVSVDRGETRVALLEATGDVPADTAGTTGGGNRRRRRPANPAAGYHVASSTWSARATAQSSETSTRARVDNVLGGLEAAFVTSALRRTASCTSMRSCSPGVEAPRRGRGSGTQITELLKPGQEIVVQVVKDPLKTKGARLSMDLHDCRPLHGLRPLRRGCRRLASSR